MKKCGLTIMVVFLLLCWFACKKEPKVIEQLHEVIEDTVKVNPGWTDSCGYTHLFACSYHVRKGVWVEVQDSFTHTYQHPDTFNFYSKDYLTFKSGGKAAAGNDTTFNSHYYFQWEILYVHQSYNQDGSPDYWYKGTYFNYATDTFSIVWDRDYLLTGKPLIVKYYRVE